MHCTLLVPGDLTTRTGGYEYDRRMLDGLRRQGWEVDVRTLDGGFPLPTGDDLARADAALAALGDGTLVLADGLALGAMPDQAAGHAARLRLIALVHHPLALETGLDPAVAARLRHSEQQALAVVRHVIVTSPQTARGLAAFAVPRDRVTVVEPGTDPAPLARGSGSSAVHMVCIASLSPRKGHAVLVRALARLRDRDWRLTCVGSTDREPEAVRALRQLVADDALSDRVVLAGEADAAEIGGYYDRSDLFVLPTFYEGYGMVVAEALARGLPVISTPTGAIAELVTPDCGILVAPGDVDGWAAALGRMFDAPTRAAFARGAAARRATLRTWADAAVEMAGVLAHHG